MTKKIGGSYPVCPPWQLGYAPVPNNAVVRSQSSVVPILLVNDQNSLWRHSIVLCLFGDKHPNLIDLSVLYMCCPALCNAHIQKSEPQQKHLYEWKLTLLSYFNIFGQIFSSMLWPVMINEWNEWSEHLGHFHGHFHSWTGFHLPKSLPRFHSLHSRCLPLCRSAVDNCCHIGCLKDSWYIDIWLKNMPKYVVVLASMILLIVLVLSHKDNRVMCCHSIVRVYWETNIRILQDLGAPKQASKKCKGHWL